MQLHPWLDKVKYLRWNELFLVTGAGGVRTDLVTLWLSAFCDQFHDIYEWQIHPRNGSSNVNFTYLYNGPWEVTVLTLIDQSYILERSFDPSSSKKLITKTHHPPDILYDITPESLRNQLHVVAVEAKNLTDQELEKIQWEFAAKSWLDNIKRIENLVNGHRRIFPEEKDLDFDTLIARALKNIIKNTLSREKLDIHCQRASESGTTIPPDKLCFLEYQEIIKPSGAEYIYEKMGLTPNSYAIEIWKRMLPLTHTPEKVYYRGSEWTLERIMNS